MSLIFFSSFFPLSSSYSFVKEWKFGQGNEEPLISGLMSGPQFVVSELRHAMKHIQTQWNVTNITLDSHTVAVYSSPLHFPTTAMRYKKRIFFFFSFSTRDVLGYPCKTPFESFELPVMLARSVWLTFFFPFSQAHLLLLLLLPATSYKLQVLRVKRVTKKITTLQGKRTKVTIQCLTWYTETGTVWVRKHFALSYLFNVRWRTYKRRRKNVLLVTTQFPVYGRFTWWKRKLKKNKQEEELSTTRWSLALKCNENICYILH